MWVKNYVPKEGETIDESLTFDCPKGYEEIGNGYWYGLKDGCICNGEFGGEYNSNLKYDKLSFDSCNLE